MQLEFTGRGRELQLLQKQADQARSGKGSLVVISGQPGIGKSRLVREFLATRESASSVSASGSENDSTSYGIWHDVIASLSRRGYKSDNPVLPDPNRSNDVDLVGDVADRFLQCTTNANVPPLIVLEDIHWLDPASLGLLNHLANIIATEPICIVATRRTDFVGTSSVDIPANSIELDLDGFSVDELTELMNQRYGQNADQSSVQKVLDATLGNPLAIYGLFVAKERQSQGPQDMSAIIDEFSLNTQDLGVLGKSIELILSPLNADERLIIAAGAMAENWSNVELAGILDIDQSKVDKALETALNSGILEPLKSDQLRLAHPLLGSTLTDDLDSDESKNLHACISRMYEKGKPPHWPNAVDHAIKSGGVIEDQHLVTLADMARDDALAQGAFEDSDRFAAIAIDSLGAIPSTTSEDLMPRILNRAHANSRIGNMETAYALYLRASTMAKETNNVDALAEAAIGFAFPPDWRTGNTEALSLVQDARDSLEKASTDDTPAKIVLDSLQSMLEMRIPHPSPDGKQWSWLIRAQIAQPRAADALDRARVIGDDYALLMALTAWRWTHRGPTFLAKRTQISTEASNLAILGNHPELLLEACVRSTVDAIESGNRIGAEEAITIAEWIATRTGDPRIQWRATALRATLPGIDGDWGRFTELRTEAYSHGVQAKVPGALVLDAILRAQKTIHAGDQADYDYAEEHLEQAARMHPLSSAVWALSSARLNRTDVAREWIRHTISILDAESSLISSVTMLAQAAVELEDSNYALELLPLVEPWSGRVACDADAASIPGPVDLVLGELYNLLGDQSRAQAFRSSGEQTLDRLTGKEVDLNRFIPKESSEGADELPQLTTRERQVLQMIAEGLTNAEIAERLKFSLATVRRDSIRIYKKLGVRGRASAVQRAADLGLLS